MIRLLTGIPRSGKSYYAVHEIIEKLNSTNKDGEFLRTLILSNIEGMKIDDARVITMEFDATFFQAPKIIPFLRNLRDENGLSDADIIHIYIDEAQRYFNRPDAETVYFFDTHGHHGVDVTIITQHEKKISPQISCHAEYEIRAAAGSTNPFSSFIYKLLQSGEQYSTTRLKRDKRVFDSYKSFQAGTGALPKSRLRYWVGALVVGAVLFWIVFFRVFASSFGLTGADKVSPGHAVAAGTAAADPGQKVLPQKSSPAPGQTSSKPTDVPESAYMGPQVVTFDQVSDSLVIEDETGTTSLPVKKFLTDYPPELYGYGYFHVSKRRFVMLNASNQHQIFPVQNPVYVRQYIQTEPHQVAQLQIHEPYGASPLPDASGMTAMDHQVRRWADLTVQGYDVARPWEKNTTPQISEGNQTVMAQKKVQ